MTSADSADPPSSIDTHGAHGGSTDGPDGARAVSLRAPSIAFAVLGVLGAAAALGLLPGAVGTLAGAVLFFFGAALPVLVRWSPVEPSALKLATLALLLSPVMTSAAYVLLHLFLDASTAVAATYVLAGAVQVLAVSKRVRLVPLGSAGRGALALAAFCAVLVVLMVFRGNAARASYHGLLHSTLVLAIDRAVPPENPFMAGTPLGYYWYWHALGALVARGLALAPTVALALVDLWAAVVLPLALYFLAAPLWRNGRRELVGVVLAIFGLNVLGGWLWLQDLLADRSGGMPWRAPTTNLEVLDVLSASVGAWDPRLAFGFSKFGNLSSYPASLALLAGGWMCAAHALRFGVRPWVGACAVLHGAAFAVNPVVGGTGLAGTGLAALLFARGLRLRVLVPLVLWTLPGLFLLILASRAYPGETVAFAFEPARVWSTLAPVLFLVVLVPFVPTDLDEDGGERRTRVLGLLLVAAFVPLVLHVVVDLPYDNQYKLVRIAALPLGVVAGGALGALLAGPAWRRGVGALLGLALGIGMLANQALGLRTYMSYASVDLPLTESALAVSPRHGSHPWRPGVYRALREVSRHERPRPALMVDAVGDLASIPAYRTGSRPADAHRFTEPVLNLQGHEAAAFSGLDLVCDRPSQALDARTPGWRERLELVRRVFHEPGALAPDDRARLVTPARPLLVLVEGPSCALVERKLVEAGFAPVWSAPAGPDGSVLAWPRELAERIAPYFEGAFE